MTAEECWRLVALVLRTKGEPPYKGGRFPKGWYEIQYIDTVITIVSSGPPVGPKADDERSSIDITNIKASRRGPLRWEQPFLRVTDKVVVEFMDEPVIEKHLRSLLVLEELAGQ